MDLHEMLTTASENQIQGHPTTRTTQQLRRWLRNLRMAVGGNVESQSWVWE